MNIVKNLKNLSRIKKLKTDIKLTNMKRHSPRRPITSEAISFQLSIIIHDVENDLRMNNLATINFRNAFKYFMLLFTQLFFTFM